MIVSAHSFGLIEELIRICILLTLEMFGKMVERIVSNVETNSMVKFFRMNPWALSRFKEFMSKLYVSSANGAAPREFFQIEKQVFHAPRTRLWSVFERGRLV